MAFVSFFEAWSLGTGIIALSNLYLGQKKALETVFMGGMSVAFVGTLICLKYETTRKRWSTTGNRGGFQSVESLHTLGRLIKSFGDNSLL
jgi:hypothetical protein